MELLVPPRIEIPEGEVGEICVEFADRETVAERDIVLFISVMPSKSL